MKIRNIFLLCILTIVFSSCGKQANISDNAKTNLPTELIIAQGADAKTLDPYASNDSPSSNVHKSIYSRLVEMTADLQIVSGLAQSWDLIDAQTIVFTLREGVQFHNGEILTARDVQFSFDRMKNSPQVAHILGPYDYIEIEDDYHFTMFLTEPFAPMIAHLTHPAAAVLNEKAVTMAGDDYGQNPVGTGPYKFVSWEAGDRITLERFENYYGLDYADSFYGGKTHINRIIYRAITDNTTRALSLENHEVNVAYALEPLDRKNIEKDPTLVLQEQPSLSYQYIGYNMEKEPFNDVRVRQAINYAINVQDIIDVVADGQAIRAHSPLGPMVWGNNKDVPLYEYNPVKARKLLSEAGFPNGFSTTAWTNDNPGRIQTLQIVQGQLKEIGIDMVIEVLEWGAFLDGTARGEHEMFILGWVTVTADADYGLYPRFYSQQRGGAGNRGFYNNPRVDELLELGRVSIDNEVRLTAYSEIQKILHDDAAEIMMYYTIQNIGYDANLKNFIMHPAQHHIGTFAYFE